jgi:hypothetical protein
VTAPNVAGSHATTSAPTAPVSAAVPANNPAPAITGTAKVGQTLTAGHGTWTGSRPITYA